MLRSNWSCGVQCYIYGDRSHLRYCFLQARLATDPETGMVLPDPKFVASNVTIPEAPEDHEWIYPYTVAPHYHSQNAGPW